MIRFVTFAASLLLLVGCPTPVEEELTPEEEPIFSNPPTDAGTTESIHYDSGTAPETTPPDGGNQTTPPETSFDAGTAPPEITGLGANMLKLLGTVRGNFGRYAPLALTAINQGMFETPAFTASETTTEEGHRVITYDYSGALLSSYPSETFIETYDAEGRFLSWHWSNEPSYTCAYHSELVACTWVRDPEGTSCTDTFTLEGDMTGSDCTDVPEAHIFCSSQMGDHVLCRYTSETLECHDNYTPELTRLDSSCVGLGFSAATHGVCTIEPNRILCNTDVNLTHCTLELSALHNVLGRECLVEQLCHWGPEECDDPNLDDCGCAWRHDARNILCEMGSISNENTVESLDTNGLLHTVLYDETPIDGDRAELYIDLAAAEFYVKMTPSGFGTGDNEPVTYGPFQLDSPPAETDGGTVICTPPQ